MKELNSHIKSKNFSRCYLFFGPEAFLLDRWSKALISAVLPEEARDMNMETFEGRIEVARIIEAAETMPFLADHRLIIINDSGLFTSGRKDASEAMSEFVTDIPENTTIIFIEKDVDKRGRLYKRTVAHGTVMEAKTPKEADLADWAVKLCASWGTKLPKSVAMYLTRTAPTDMSLLYNELAKLAAYKADGSEITNADVGAICTKSLEAKIFDLMRDIGNKDAKLATTQYANLIAAKESPLMVLSMIARQFRYYLQCTHLAPRMSQKDIATKLALHPFAVREFIEGGRNFSRPAMLTAFENCLETDFAIKSGQIGDVLGVEVLIVKICAV
ncbi:MAG: DNA polymerase III subunit delta [Defluviitaleaceae bacterium]|nr:DNA polymerase III subunit delta [Defluviitaleaceae bacterium]